MTVTIHLPSDTETGLAARAKSIYGDRALLAEIDAADAALARGEGQVITEESMRQLAWDVKPPFGPACSVRHR